MSLESVRAWIAQHAPDLPIIEVEASTATVETAATALGVLPGRIAKTLAVHTGDRLQSGAVGLPAGLFEVTKRARGVIFGDEQAEASGDLGRRRWLVAEQGLVGSHELRRADVARQGLADGAATEVPANPAGAVAVFVDVFEFKQSHPMTLRRSLCGCLRPAGGYPRCLP